MLARLDPEGQDSIGQGPQSANPQPSPMSQGSIVMAIVSLWRIYKLGFSELSNSHGPHGLMSPSDPMASIEEGCTYLVEVVM